MLVQLPQKDEKLCKLVAAARKERYYDCYNQLRAVKSGFWLSQLAATGPSIVLRSV